MNIVKNTGNFIMFTLFLSMVYGATKNSEAAAQQPKSQRARQNESSQQGIAQDAKILLDAKTEEFRDTSYSRIRKILESQLGNIKFALLITIKLDEEAFLADARKSFDSVQLKSIPRKLDSADLQKAHAESLDSSSIRKYLSNIEAQVTLNEGVSENQKSLATQLVASALKIPTTNIKLSVEALDNPSVLEKFENVSKKIETVEKEKTALEQESRQVEIKSKIENQKILQEKNTLDILVKQLETQNSETLRQLQEAKQQITEQQLELSVYQTPLGDIKKIVKGLEIPMLVLPFIVVALIVTLVTIFFYSRVSKEKTKRLFDGIELVSLALGKIGNRPVKDHGLAQQNLLNTGTQPTSKAIAALATIENRDLADRPSNRSHFSSISENELKELVQESKAAWATCKQYQYLLMSELKEWANDTFSSKLRLLNLLTILPATECQAMVSKLSSEDISALKMVFHEPLERYTGHRIAIALAQQLMLTSITLPQTLLQMNELSMVKATDRQLATFLADLEPQMISTALSLLPQTRFIRIVNMLQPLQPSLKIEEVFAAMPEALDDLNALEVLCQHLKTWNRDLLQRDDRSRHRVSELLWENIENATEELRSKVYAAAEINPRLAPEKQEQAVSINDFLKISAEVIKELLDPYDSENLAKLFTGLNQPLIEKFASVLSNKMRNSTELEFRRLTSSDLIKKRAMITSKQLQQELILGLQELVSQGVVEINSIDPKQTHRGRIEAAQNSESQLLIDRSNLRVS